MNMKSTNVKPLTEGDVPIGCYFWREKILYKRIGISTIKCDNFPHAESLHPFAEIDSIDNHHEDKKNTSAGYSSERTNKTMKQFGIETMWHFNKITVRDAVIDWSVRTHNLLHKYGYIDNTVSELFLKATKHENEIRRNTGIGWKTIREIKERLVEYIEGDELLNGDQTLSAIKLTEENAERVGIATGNSMSGELYIGRPMDVNLFEKELNDIRAKNGWKIIIEFGGIMSVTVFDKESGKRLAETGATSLLGILWALQQPLESDSWYKF